MLLKATLFGWNGGLHSSGGRYNTEKLEKDEKEEQRDLGGEGGGTANIKAIKNKAQRIIFGFRNQ